MSLKQYEKNIQSQFGEDGIIEEIFKRIGTTNKICVEFGAWDGIHLSNVWNLWNNHQWNALLIEGDKNKYEHLVKNTEAFKNVKPFLAYVKPEGEHSLDKIFKELNYPKDIDLLSIDIDGDDYYIFEKLLDFTPRVLIVEYNPTIPPGVEIVQKQGEYFGSSALSLLKLGNNKGYKLAHATDTNLFFIEESIFSLLKFDEPSLKDVFVPDHLSYVISGYDGKSFLVGTPPYFNLEPLPVNYDFPKIITENININPIIINKTILEKKELFLDKIVSKLKR